MPESFHKFERKLQLTKVSIQRADISSINKRSILDFGDYCFSEGLSVPRVEKYLGYLKTLVLLFHKDFIAATRSDLEGLLRIIERREYSEWTKRDFRVTLKKFYRWLRGGDEDPPETAWIRCRGQNSNHMLPEELLTEDDVSRLIDACGNPRDKAFVAVLYESGCRIGEMASLKIKHVVPDTHGLHMIVHGKTGARRILTISSVPYLTEWLNVHPRKSDPQAYLWVINDYRCRRLTYHRMSDILKNAVRRAGITKRVNPHTFRHSRATYLAKFLTEAQMCEFFGWVQGSDMLPIYVHLTGRDVDGALLKTYGIDVDTKEASESKLKPKICQRCEVQNAPTNKFCSRCGTVLDEHTARQVIKYDLEMSRVSEIMATLIRDPEFRDLVQRKRQELAKRKS